MSKPYRGIFLDPIHPDIKAELERRASVEEFRGTEDFNSDPKMRENFNKERQKLAWCKLLSNARGNDITPDVAYHNQLFMGHLTPELMGKQGLSEKKFSEAIKAGTAMQSNPGLHSISEGFGRDGAVDYNLNDRNRPRPGIDKVSIMNKGQLGSIRQATIDFFVWTEDDLKLMEKLYMIPGITCLLEWGWSTYKANTIKDENYSYGDMNKVQKHIVARSLGHGGPAGNYDGMLGVISKFNWQVNENGGYQCQTTIISPNALIGEMDTTESHYNMQISDWYRATHEEGTQHPPEAKILSDIEGILQSIQGGGTLLEVSKESSTYHETAKKKSESADDNTKFWVRGFRDLKGFSNFWKNSLMESSMWGYLGQQFANHNLTSQLYRIKDTKKRSEVGWKGKTYAFNTYIPTEVSPNKMYTVKDNWQRYSGAAKSIKPIAFVSWRFIEDILLPTIKSLKSAKGGSLLEVMSVHEVEAELTTEEKKKGKPQVEANKIRNNPLIRSLDQEVCFLPGQHYTENILNETDSAIELGQPKGTKGGKKLRSEGSRTPSLPYPSNDPTMGSRQLSTRYQSMKQTYAMTSINYEELTALTDKYYLDPFYVKDSEDNPNLHEGYLRNIMVNVDFVLSIYRSTKNIKDFVKGLLDGINTACGSPWNFQIQVNPTTPNRMNIIDEKWTKGETKESEFKFEPNTYKSIIKKVSLDSKLPSAVQASAFIGATRNQKKGGSGTAGWTAFSYGMYDKYTGAGSQGEPDLREEQVDEDDSWTSQPLTPKESFLYKNWLLSLKCGYSKDDLQKECKVLLDQYLNDRPDSEIGNSSASDIRPLIPLDLSIDIDGLSGIYMGNAINISSVSEGGILPDRYSGQVTFQATDITHMIQSFQWETTIKGMMRMTGYTDDESGKGPGLPRNQYYLDQREKKEKEKQKEKMEFIEEDIVVTTLVKEASNQGTIGLAAVMLVLMNRVDAKHLKSTTLTEVCQKPYQFSMWDPMYSKDSKIYKSEESIVKDAKNKGMWNHAKKIYQKRDQLPQGLVGFSSFYGNPDAKRVKMKKDGKTYDRDIYGQKQWVSAVKKWVKDMAYKDENKIKRRIIGNHVFSKWDKRINEGKSTEKNNFSNPGGLTDKNGKTSAAPFGLSVNSDLATIYFEGVLKKIFGGGFKPYKGSGLEKKNIMGV